MDKKDPFLRNHADTLTIIGVNIVVFGLLVTLCLSNMSNITAVNARIDTLHIMIYDLIKEGRK